MILFAFLLAAQLAKPQPPGLIAFMKATGYPNGRPGWVVDHRLPVCAGGDPNDANNLQWQEKAASYRKDVCERQLCAEMKRQGYVLVKRDTTDQGFWISVPGKIDAFWVKQEQK